MLAGSGLGVLCTRGGGSGIGFLVLAIVILVAILITIINYCFTCEQKKLCLYMSYLKSNTMIRLPLYDNNGVRVISQEESKRVDLQETISNSLPPWWQTLLKESFGEVQE